MSPERFNEVLGILVYGPRQLAALLGRGDDRRVRRWQTGERTVPDDVAEWLEGLVGYFARNPPPQVRSRSRDGEGGYT